MDRREAIDILVGVIATNSEEENEALDLAIEALGQTETTDSISRQQAIEALTGWETEPLDEDIVRTLESLPPVTLTERTGEWVDREQCQVDEDAYDVAICSNCKAEITLEYSNDNYCPNCGAKMKGGTEND